MKNQLFLPSSASQKDPVRTLGGRADKQTGRHTPRPGVPVRTHLGRRLSEQRPVIQTTGAIGPGREVLHFGVPSLPQVTQNRASIPSLSLKSKPPHLACSPGTHSRTTGESGKSRRRRRRRRVDAQTRGIRQLRPSPTFLFILSSCCRK